MNSDSTDEALMSAVCAGGIAELGLLFDRHHRSLYEFFFRMTGDKTFSEDLVQDVFDRLVRYRDTLPAGGHFRVWLFRFARSVHHDRSRKFDGETSPTGIPIHLMDRTAGLRLLLLALPEDRRELIVLSQYEILTIEEIAELLEVEEPKARLRLHRALMELRELFGHSSYEKRRAM